MSTEVFQTITDVVDGTTTYFCQADPGVATTDPYWSIYKQTTSGGVVTRMYPIGTNHFPTFKPMFRAAERAAYNYGLVPEYTAPTLSTVTIASDNTVTTTAKVGDTVTITIVASESLGSLTADISTGSAGTLYTSAATITRTSGTSWSASRVMTSSDVDGTVTFRIKFTDVGGTAGTDVTAITGGSEVTFDETVGSITTATMASNNATTTLAKSGDVVTLTFISSEDLTSKPTVTIAGHAIAGGNVTQGIDASHWTATYTMVGGDSNGLVAFTINGTDIAGNAITECTALTSGSGVTYDKTLPTLASSTRTNNTTIDVVLSEAAATASITKANDGGFVVAETGAPGTTYAVSAIAPGVDNTHVVLTVANLAVSAAEGVTVTYANAGNGTVADPSGNLLATDATGVTVAAWDVVAPTMSSAERLSNTVVKVTFSEDLDNATMTHANDGGFVVYETGTPATTYAVSGIAKSGSNNDMIELTVADMTASAAVGVTVTYATGGNGDIADVGGTVMVTDATGVNAAAWA